MPKLFFQSRTKDEERGRKEKRGVFCAKKKRWKKRLTLKHHGAKRVALQAFLFLVWNYSLSPREYLRRH